MRKLWRIVWITITALIGLFLLLIITLSQLDSNQFKDTIEKQVTELTGRQLNIDGDIEIELSLQPLIRIEKASFANAAWGSQDQMLSFDLLQLKIDLVPLFENKLIVEQLLLEGVYLSVETNVDGKNNWQLEGFSDDEADVSESEDDSDSFQLPFLPLLKQARLDGFHFYYSDAVEKIETDIIADLQLLNSAVDDEAFILSAKGKVNDYPFDISGEAGFLTTVTTKNITDQGVRLKLNADALGASLIVDGVIKNPVSVEDIDIALSLDVEDLDKTFTSVSKRSIYSYIPKSEKQLPLNFSANLTDENNGYELGAIKIKLADTDIEGSFSYRDHAARPEITAKLYSDNVNLDRFLAKIPATSKQTREIKSQPENKKTKIELPDTALHFDLLKSVDADISYSINRFQYDGIKPRKIKIDAALHDGLLRVKQFDFNLDGSHVHSRLAIDSNLAAPRIDTILDIDNFQLSLIAQRFDIEQLKNGTLLSKIKLNSRGKSIKSLITNLKGTADIKLSELKLDHQLKNKKHRADIKTLNLNFTGMKEPFRYALDGAIGEHPLSLTGQLDSLATVLENETVGLNFNLAVLKIRLDVDGSVNNPLNMSGAQIDIAIDVPSPKESILKISEFIPEIKTHRVLADLPIKINGKLTVSPDEYRFENMQLKAGDNDLSGYVYADLRGEKPSIEADLKSQLIDLNELVPGTVLEDDGAPEETVQPQSNEQETTNPERTKLFSDKPLPALEALDSIEINLAYTLQKLTSNDQVIDNISLNMVLKDSLLKLDPLSVVFSQGTIETKLELSVVNKPHMKIDTTINKLAYDRLMAILGTKEYARGELDAEISLSADGVSISELMANLNGVIRVTAVDGELNSDSLKLLSKDLVSVIPFTDTSDRQKINCGVLQFNIHNGVAVTHAMVINTGAVSALGTGGIDLANETLSLYVAPRSKRTSVIKLAMVPVNITGPLVSPSVTPDIAGSAISTTKTATNIGLTIVTSGVWLLAEGLTNQLWDKFIDDTDYCARALAGDEIAPRRIQLEDSEDDEGFDDDDEYAGW